jgi:cellulose biosynthesis protein BcsQ
MNNNSQSGIVYTFYSFKGGVGRSMALANCAALLAKWGYRVLAVDWDLEAPGLERFFANVPGSRVVEARARTFGVVDLIGAWAKDERLDWRSCTISVPISNGKSKLDLISAGKSDERYSSKLHGLDFPRLFEDNDLGDYIETLRDEWAEAYDFVLIDSRTGVTDIGGICTVHLADVLILLFTTTDSSILGLSQIVDGARAARAKLPRDRAALVAVPVPARDESRTEYRKSQEWKRITADKFRGLYEDWLPASVTAEDAVEILRIPYVPFWSFGEKLPAIEEGTKDPTSLGRAYEVLARLLASRLNWVEAVEAATVPASRDTGHALEESWLEDQRRSAAQESRFLGLGKPKSDGYFEAYYCCSEQLDIRNQKELLDLAERAESKEAMPRIGIIRSGAMSKPKPRANGIQATIREDDRVQFWALSQHLDFYCRVTPVEVGERRYLYLNRRIPAVAELLSHAYSVYSLAGLQRNSVISLTVVHHGLSGLILENDLPVGLPYYSLTPAAENQISTSVSFTLDGLQEDFVSKVMEICEPLFRLFDFQAFEREAYEFHSRNHSMLKGLN